ncbi:Dbl homology domain-containing protein [Radiomyces spectabilis]|uniref:Dbl homology domain-containing protein n=1 Tax=Radiomyces spectabilis TaxID=64574 RepID=UPI002220A646|nr:Dbl homology domain-containing protein [Radiomyces spectabilis]KAI8371329.1 Dbl homology domain-containing protein [Radiomyces spectabilis]
MLKTKHKHKDKGKVEPAPLSIDTCLTYGCGAGASYEHQTHLSDRIAPPSPALSDTSKPFDESSSLTTSTMNSIQSSGESAARDRSSKSSWSSLLQPCDKPKQKKPSSSAESKSHQLISPTSIHDSDRSDDSSFASTTSDGPQVPSSHSKKTQSSFFRRRWPVHIKRQSTSSPLEGLGSDTLTYMATLPPHFTSNVPYDGNLLYGPRLPTKTSEASSETDTSQINAGEVSPTSTDETPPSSSASRSSSTSRSSSIDHVTSIFNEASSESHVQVATTDDIPSKKNLAPLSRPGLIRRRSSCPGGICRKTSSPARLSPGETLDAAHAQKRNQSRPCSLLQKKHSRRSFADRMKTRSITGESDLSFTLTSATSNEDKKLGISDVVDPISRRPLLRFSSMKPRSGHQRRRTSTKREIKALKVWHEALEDSLKQQHPPSSGLDYETMAPEKRDKVALTRKFILRELYTTEVTFWNQLYYAKVIFHDLLIRAIEQNSPFARPEDVEYFSNLWDLMEFSSSFIQRLRLNVQYEPKLLNPTTSPFEPPEIDIKSVKCPSDVLVGQALCDLAEDLVVFLRCAIDYKTNRKMLDTKTSGNKLYMAWRDKLMSRKETRQFTMSDYLIIPIQRVARYGLLLADLLKHTEPTHPDYYEIYKAHKLVTSLATAMNYAQK